MKSLAFVLLCSLFIFGKCKKDSDIVNEDYSPLSIGSNWTYLSNGSTFKLTVTNKDTLALGHTYKVLSNSNGANQYQANHLTEYYRFATFQGILPNGIEELYLKPDQNVGTTWQFNIPLLVSTVTVNITAKYTISEKGISKTVQGKNYINVIHVRQDFTSAFGNNGGGDYYYARGIGLISSTLAVTFPGQNVNNTTELVSYEIK